MTSTATPKHTAKRSFRTKLSLFGALAAAVPLVAAGIVLLNVNRDAVETLSREVQLAVAEDIGRALDASLRDAQDGLDAVGRILTDAEVAETAAEELARGIVAGTEALDHVAVYDGEGQLIDVIFVGDAAPIDTPESLSAALRESAIEHGVGTGEAVPGEHAARVPVVVPLFVGDTPTGFTASLVSLEEVQRRVEHLSHMRFEGHPDSPYVVDEQQRLLAHPDGSRAANLESVAGRGILAGVDPGAVSGGFQQSGEYQGEAEPMVGTIVGLRGRNWGVVAQVPERIAYASIYRMRNVIVLSVLAFLVIALAVAFFFARQITEPVKALVRYTEHLAARRFGERLTLDTEDELSVLASAMSEAAADLQVSEAQIRKEIEIRSDLGRYLPAELVDKVVKREQDMSLGGQRLEISVLFADVVAFTPMTDDLAPEDVVTVLNELFTILTDIVFRHGGTIDKFIGDCVMALWGAPTPQESHAELALAAAEDMVRWLEAGNAGWQERFGITIQLAIGVNTGQAVVGNVGSETRMEYTAIGDTVNVAARLEGIARPGQILVTAATQEAAGPGYEFHDIGSRNLTGRAEPIHLYELRP